MKYDLSIPILPCHAKRKNQNTKSHTHIHHLDKMRMEIRGMVFSHTGN